MHAGVYMKRIRWREMAGDCPVRESGLPGLLTEAFRAEKRQLIFRLTKNLSKAIMCENHVKGAVWYVV